MPIYKITTRMVSYPVYMVEADTEEEARRLVDEEGGLDAVDEPVVSEDITFCIKVED